MTGKDGKSYPATTKRRPEREPPPTAGKLDHSRHAEQQRIERIGATSTSLSAQLGLQGAAGAAGGYAALDQLRAERNGVPIASNPLLLFCGENNNTFLGCLNCSEIDPDSVVTPLDDSGAISPPRAS